MHGIRNMHIKPHPQPDPCLVNTDGGPALCWGMSVGKQRDPGWVTPTRLVFCIMYKYVYGIPILYNLGRGTLPM